MKKNKKKIFYVLGMHCVSCEVLIEKEIKKISGVKSSKSNFKKGTLEVEGENISIQEIKKVIKKCGHKIVDNKKDIKSNTQKFIFKDLWQISIIFLVFIFLVSLFSKFKVTKFFPKMDENISIIVALLFGVIASVSTCLALTGGIVISFSSKYKIKKNTFFHRVLPQIYFHIGRILGFAVLGGLFGLLGEKLVYSTSFTGYLTILVGLVMFYVGLNILNIVPNISRFGFHLPKKLSSGINILQKNENPVIPAIIGILTFFLPCGFTQSMQLAAVASGSFLSGTLIMMFFAIGTLPVLFSIGIGSSYTQKKDFRILKKIIGVVIIFFAFYSFNSGLILSGSNFTIDFWNKGATEKSIISVSNESVQTIENEPVQTIEMEIDYTFQQSEFRIKKDIPVRWKITPTNVTGCTEEVIIPSLNLSTGKLKSGGKTVILEFTPTETGNLLFSCWMGMQKGKFIVEENIVSIKKEDSKENTSEQNKLEWHTLVEYAGALKNSMLNGDITAKMKLSKLQQKKNLYALGAVGNLKGEIQIFNSKPIITSVKNEKIVFDDTFKKKASLIVYTQVLEWKDFKVPNKIKNRKEFENYLKLIAEKNGLDTKKPFPFLLNGKFKKNDWHVIDWDENDKEHTHEKHRESGLYGTIKNTDFEMLGFFSTNHAGIYTHHTTNMHIHFKTKDNTLAGHSDDFILGNNVILKLPIK